MNSDYRQDRIDPLLAAAYAELRGEAAPEVDWEALQRSIARRAEPIISRRKVRKLVRFARPMVPLALAASLAFGLMIAPAYVNKMLAPAPVAAAVEMDAEEILIHAVDDELSDEDFRRLVTGRANPEALLASAMSGH